MIWLLIRVSLVPVLLASVTVAILNSHSADHGERAGAVFSCCLFLPIYLGLWIVLYRRRSLLRSAWSRG